MIPAPINNLEEIEFFFPNMHVTRSSLKKGDVVPLHAHGNKYGFVYVLTGRCQIANYAIVERGDSSFVLELVADQEYTDHQYTIVSKKNNVHHIVALEDTTFLDAFSVGSSDETIQHFLKITGQPENKAHINVEFIDIKEANIAQHLLDKVCTEIKITD